MLHFFVHHFGMRLPAYPTFPVIAVEGFENGFHSLPITDPH